MILEICANSFDSAVAAQDAGADRIELCVELSVGGLTPSLGLVEKVLHELKIPVHVLIRPRTGNFTYTSAELDIMQRNIDMYVTLGCHGIVSGALTKNHDIDVTATSKLIEATGQKEFTFHRAFDWCQHPEKAIGILKKLGVTRILSSGQKATAIKGISLLKTLKEKSKGMIQIMPGGGINSNNCLDFKEAGFDMIHCSATKKVQHLIETPMVSMHSIGHFKEGIIATSDIHTIKKIIEKVKM